jgi:hypothetical protein
MKPKKDDTTNVYISPNAPPYVREALTEALTQAGAHITEVPSAYMEELVMDSLLDKKTGTEESEEFSRYFTKDMPDDLKRACLEAIEAKRTSMKSIKDKLLEDAAKKEPHLFFQFDGYAGNVGGVFIDNDGDSCSSGKCYELRRHVGEVRVFIPIGANANDVLRLLKKARKWIKRSPEVLSQDPVPCTANTQSTQHETDPFDDWCLPF